MKIILRQFCIVFQMIFSVFIFASLFNKGQLLTLLHSERPKLYTILAFLSAKGLKEEFAMLLMIRCPFGKVSSLPFGMIVGEGSKQEVTGELIPFVNIVVKCRGAIH